MKWNKIENGIPEEDGKYIVCTENGVVLFARFYKHGSGGHFGIPPNVKITHWMPFPKPPRMRKRNKNDD